MSKKPILPGGRKSFEATLERSQPGMDAAYVSIPFDVEKEYGTRGQVKVKATFDGVIYRGILANMGRGGHQIGVLRDIRKTIGKKIGDTVTVTLERDTAERTVELPTDLQKLFSKNSRAGAFYHSLSFTNRKEYALWISSAKKPETRTRRLQQTLKMLLAGKMNPSDK